MPVVGDGEQLCSRSASEWPRHRLSTLSRLARTIRVSVGIKYNVVDDARDANVATHYAHKLEPIQRQWRRRALAHNVALKLNAHSFIKCAIATSTGVGDEQSHTVPLIGRLSWGALYRRLSETHRDVGG